MDEIIIEKKKYVILPKDDYEALRKRAVKKYKPEKGLTVSEARAQTKKLIRQWAGVK